MASALAYENVHKRFGDRVVLDDVTFAVDEGEVFGLLGPNGAGKTTLIRLALDILREDGGAVRLLGVPVREADHDRVAYLPEERGLYRQARVLDVMVYLAKLKGLSGGAARARSLEWLEKVGLAHTARMKIEQLSKGMSQKVQIAATLVADPDLVILDEPFSGLDPIHVEGVLELIRDRRARGRTTILATHLMNRVEAVCDRMVLMSRGRRVLYGTVDAIRRAHGHDEVRVEAERLPAEHPMIAAARPEDGGAVTLALADGVDPAALLEALVAAGARVRSFEPRRTSVEQIFKTTVREREAS